MKAAAVRVLGWLRDRRPKVHLRAFPLPFQGALAIANDADGDTWDNFRELLSFICTGEPTRFGKGLELEFASGRAAATGGADQPVGPKPAALKKKSRSDDPQGSLL